MKITIREAAHSRGKSLYRLSMDLGIPHQTVYDWENLNKMPRPEYLDAVCHYLGCKISEILKTEKYDYAANSVLNTYF